MRRLLRELLWNDDGAELLEYALIGGLIVVTAIATIGSAGTKVLSRWNSANGPM